MRAALPQSSHAPASTASRAFCHCTPFALSPVLAPPLTSSCGPRVQATTASPRDAVNPAPPCRKPPAPSWIEGSIARLPMLKRDRSPLPCRTIEHRPGLAPHPRRQPNADGCSSLLTPISIFGSGLVMRLTHCIPGLWLSILTKLISPKSRQDQDLQPNMGDGTRSCLQALVLHPFCLWTLVGWPLPLLHACRRHALPSRRPA